MLQNLQSFPHTFFKDSGRVEYVAATDDEAVEALLFLIQIASILGILVFALKKERDRIPFVPCLFLSYHALLLYTMFCR